MRLDAPLTMRTVLLFTTRVTIALLATWLVQGGFDAGASARGAEGTLYERLGTAGDDTMIGGPPPGGGMAGLGGNDTLISEGRQKDFLYGGEGDDLLEGHKNLEGIPSSDDLFGAGFCRETGYYGFERTAERESWPDPATLDCNIDGADVLRGGAGDDWLWESNSDQTGDGQVDLLHGGPGFDVCVAEAIDTVRECEDVRIIPTNPDL